MPETVGDAANNKRRRIANDKHCKAQRPASFPIFTVNRGSRYFLGSRPLPSRLQIAGCAPDQPDGNPLNGEFDFAGVDHDRLEIRIFGD